MSYSFTDISENNLSKTVSSIFINNKEVESITCNNEIIYQKESRLVLNSNKQLISFLDEDSCILTATLKENNIPMENEPIIFKSEEPLNRVFVNSSGTYNFENSFLIDMKYMSLGSIIIGDPNSDINGTTDDYIYMKKYLGTDNTYIYYLRIANNNTVSAMYGARPYSIFILDDRIYYTTRTGSDIWNYVSSNLKDISEIDLTQWTISDTNIIVQEYLYEIANTNSNGQASCTYSAQGFGDINVVAKYETEGIFSNVTKIEDCDAYFITSQITSWKSQTQGANNFRVSSYAIPEGNFSLEFKCNNPAQIGVGNKTDWLLACNVVIDDSVFYTHDLSGTVNNTSQVFNSTAKTYLVTVEGTKMTAYGDNNLIISKAYRKINGYPRTLRIYPMSNSQNVDYIKIKKIETQIPMTLQLSSSKDILSQYDSETATLTAQVFDQNGNYLEGESVVFKNGNTILNTQSTDINGQASYTYSAAGVGDVKITAECKSLSETYNIEDCTYYNDGTKITGLDIATGVSVTSENNALKITTNTSGEKNVFYPIELTSTDNFSYEIETVTGGTTDLITLVVKTGSTASGLWCAYKSNENKFTGGFYNTTFNYNYSPFKNEDKLKVIHNNGNTSIYINDILMKSIDGSWSNTFKVGHYTNNGRIQYVKNIKIQRL